MSRNYYSEINLHLVWHTKESAPLLTEDIALTTHAYLKKRIVATPGLYVHAIGGIETHVHPAITIQPTLNISEFVGQLKGASAHETNQRFHHRGKVLEWQAGYGVVSFGTRDLPWVVAYIENQREHHQRGTTAARLEQISANEEKATA